MCVCEREEREEREEGERAREKEESPFFALSKKEKNFWREIILKKCEEKN